MSVMHFLEYSNYFNNFQINEHLHVYVYMVNMFVMYVFIHIFVIMGVSVCLSASYISSTLSRSGAFFYFPWLA